MPKPLQTPRLLGKHPNKAKARKPAILIFGEPGVGKTWGCLDFPAVYYIDAEGGASLPHYTDRIAKADGLYLGPADGANDMDIVVSQIQALATQPHDRKTVVVDSFSKVFNSAIQLEYDRLASTRVKGQDRDMTKSFGAEKKPAIAKTRQIVAWLDRLDMNMIFVCHQKTKWEDGDAAGFTYDAWDKLAYELDLTMQIIKTGKTRRAKIIKSRLEQFTEGETIEWNYQAFAEKWGVDITEATPETLELATEDQVTRLEYLVYTLRTTEETIQKWHTKAGVTSFAEMDAHTIERCIDHLEKQMP